MISPTKVYIDNFPFAEDNSNKKSFVLIYGVDSWQSEYSKEGYLYAYRSIL